MKLLTLILILASLTASAQKKQVDTTLKFKKVNRDTVWTSAHRYDTMVVMVEDASGKFSNVRAVYEWGHYAANKDMPRFYGYLSMNNRKLTTAQKPKRVRYDKMKPSDSTYRKLKGVKQ